LRPITTEEFAALHRVLFTAFGEDATPESVEYERIGFEPERSIAAIEDGEFGGSAGAYSFELTLPGGERVPAAGVTWVGVLPTHRRTGLLRSMMVRQLDDIAGRGEPVAVLTASEGSIYGRFGYGAATFYASVDLPTQGTEFLRPPAAPGRIRLVPADAAAKVLPPLLDATRAIRPGMLSRSEAFWEGYLQDPQWRRDGASARWYAVHEGAAGPDGYVAYRVKGAGEKRGGSTVEATHLHAPDPEVEAALCRYLLDIDLAAKVSFRWRPTDDPLRWRLANQDRYQVRRLGDWLWVRLVDVETALAARRYTTAGILVLEVTDPFRPDRNGTYRLEGGPDGAVCQRVAAPVGGVDVTLQVDALGSAYLGGVSFATLAAAGRVQGDPAAQLRADAMFTWTPPPYCDQPF
jgi:predicted acetyltransferase